MPVWPAANRHRLHLQVFVGVTEIGTLQPVRPTDWVEASKVMRKWASSDDSGAAVALSAQYLATVIKVSWALHNKADETG